MPRFDVTTLKQRPPGAFAVERAVRFQDVDAAGIVFFPRIFEYCHDALFEFLAAHGHRADEAIRDRGWGLPLRHAEADFLSPLRFGDSIEVALVRVAIDPTEVTVGYRLARLADAAVVAVAETTHVFVQMKTLQRTDLPAALCQVFEALAADGS